MSVIKVNQNNFENEVVRSQIPVLVDFWAEWCGPCRMISPIIDDIAGELEGKLKVVKINVDESQELAAKHNIMSIPTLLIFKGGEPVDHIVGAMPKDQIMEKVKAQLA